MVGMMLVASPATAAASAQPRVAAAAGDVHVENIVAFELRNSDGRLEDFAIGSGNALFHRWQLSPGGNWSGWASLGGWVTSIDGARNADGRLEVFARGGGNAVYNIWQVSAGGGWSGWGGLGGVLTDGPYVSVLSNGALSVGGVGTTGYWYRNYQTSPGCCWSGWAIG